MRPISTLAYRQQELAFRTQYAELKERTRAAGPLLPGTPGTLTKRSGTGYSYWYRVYYPVPGKQSETLVCKDGDDAALDRMREHIAFSDWSARQVAALRKLGFQVADKAVARVLVELHNQDMFEAGLTLVGTLAYMAWLNELGAVAITARTQDIDLARGRPLKLAVPRTFMSTMQATELPFVAVPGMRADTPATSVKLPGVQGLRVDVLAPGEPVGTMVRTPELDWCAQAIPFYDYLLDSPEPAAMLAGGHCVPVRLPQPARFVWHKLYSSTQRAGFREKADKDRRQAITMAAILADQEPDVLLRAFAAADEPMVAAIRGAIPSLGLSPDRHPTLYGILEACAGGR